jgi:uncharacterized membrane-anchored protein
VILTTSTAGTTMSDFMDRLVAYASLQQKRTAWRG